MTGVKFLSVLILLAFPVSGFAGVYGEIGIGANLQLFGGEKWETNGGTGAFLSVGYEFNKFRIFGGVPIVHLTHLSQWDVGAPWNSKSESAVDHLGIKIQWK